MIENALDDLCRELTLPGHIYYDSLEELLLLNALHCLAAAVERNVPPSLSMASTNELCYMASRLLPPEELERFQEYAAALGRLLPGTDTIGFPPMLGPPQDGMHEAEFTAAGYLQTGSGSLWSAVRHVVSLLPFREVKRQHQAKLQQQFSAGAYGHRGFVGLCKQTEQFGSVLCLLNMLACSLHSGHAWTTVVITVNNVAGLHVDRQNAPFCSLVIGLSHHCQGHMWIQRSRGMPWTGPGLAPAAAGHRLDVSAKAYLLPTFSHPHCTEPSTVGDRLVLIAYVIGQYESLSSSHVCKLQDLGFCPPRVIPAGASSTESEIEVSVHVRRVAVSLRSRGLFRATTELCAGCLAIRGGPADMAMARRTCRPTGDIVPVALFAFELEVSGIAADARHIYTPERLVDSVGLTMVDPGGLMPGCALLTPAQSCRNTAAVAEAVVTRWEHRRKEWTITKRMRVTTSLALVLCQ
ncbi:unnamed protein product [Symbiodinium microadriaticum]|nr:unnamed protein product [Symbiodinium sp. KB8]CAE7903166.1 unnamed protein product [Symbiodinium microadriaticum]